MATPLNVVKSSDHTDFKLDGRPTEFRKKTSSNAFKFLDYLETLPDGDLVTVKELRERKICGHDFIYTAISKGIIPKSYWVKLPQTCNHRGYVFGNVRTITSLVEKLRVQR